MIPDPLELSDPPGETAWMADARCKGMTELMFPAHGKPTAPAKAVCRECEVRPQCLDYALDRPELSGVLAGLSEVERKNLRRGRARWRLCNVCRSSFVVAYNRQTQCSDVCRLEARRRTQRNNNGRRGVER